MGICHSNEDRDGDAARSPSLSLRRGDVPQKKSFNLSGWNNSVLKSSTEKVDASHRKSVNFIPFPEEVYSLTAARYTGVVSIDFGSDRTGYACYYTKDRKTYTVDSVSTDSKFHTSVTDPDGDGKVEDLVVGLSRKEAMQKYPFGDFYTGFKDLLTRENYRGYRRSGRVPDLVVSQRQFGWDAMSLQSMSTVGDVSDDNVSPVGTPPARRSSQAMPYSSLWNAKWKAADLEDEEFYKEMRVSDLMIAVLRHCRDLAMDELSQACEGGIDYDDVLWVLCVPSAWSSTSRRLMRGIAVTAGLAESLEADNLVLAEVAECSFLSCYTFGGDIEHTIAGNRRKYLAASQASISSIASTGMSEMETVHEGDVFIALDVGLDSTDLTVNLLERENPLLLRELETPAGGAFGVSLLRREFDTFLCDLLGLATEVELHNKMTSEQQVALYDIFEDLKDQYFDDSYGGANARSNQPYDLDLTPLMKHWSNKKLKKCVRRYNKKLLKASESKLKMSKDEKYILIVPGWQVARWVRPLVRKVLREVAKLHRKFAVSAIYVTGGGAYCGHFVSELRRHFEERDGCAVIVPGSPELCALEGGLIYGLAVSGLEKMGPD
eukprot:GFYU01006101.1.p1 GENE.GFYU01006101.1~~GFYU01006101.1.p1  ORF type:complete len:605 (+),score=93.03 GFYU01006101.1:536-2350(+)